jgi:hypothetical protein
MLASAQMLPGTHLAWDVQLAVTLSPVRQYHLQQCRSSDMVGLVGAVIAAGRHPGCH